MHIGADICERGVGIRMRDIFAGENRNVAICAMYILFYTTDPIEWDKSVNLSESKT